MFCVMFRKEVKMTIFSRRFLYALILLFLPVGVAAWFCHTMYLNPSILSRMTGGWFSPITPRICMMVYLDVAPLPVALIAIIFSSGFIAGEQERGTLFLLLSKPLSRAEIVLAKYLSFLLIFLGLVALSLLLFSVSLKILGIGSPRGIIFFSYLLALFCTGIVYTSLGTIFSVMTEKTLTAILTGFLLLVTWYLFDWIINYLPYSIAQTLEKFSLSYYINRIIGYASHGKAVLFLGGRVPEFFSPIDLTAGLLVIVGLLTCFPLVASALVFKKKDIRGP